MTKFFVIDKSQENLASEHLLLIYNSGQHTHQAVYLMALMSKGTLLDCESQQESIDFSEYGDAALDDFHL